LTSFINNAQAPGGNVYTSAINANESAGKQDTSTVVNPASGASGSMQTMGPTRRDPGYGVKPAQDDSPQESARVGRDYYNALNAKYKDPTTAAIAYDWGPGNTDKWLANGGDMSQVPDESLKYAINFNKHVDAINNATGGAQAPQPANAPVATAAPTHNLGFRSMSDFEKQFPSSGGGDANPVTAFGAGVGSGFGQGVLGVQALAGRGMQAIGAKDVGDWLVNNAQTGAKNLQTQAQAAGGGGFAQKAGEVVGGTAPYLLAPTTLVPQIAAGALGGASSAALANQPIAAGAVEGAGMGAGGVVGGKVLGATLDAAGKPITNLVQGLKGGEPAAAAGFARAIGPQDMPGTIAGLRAGADSAMPGVQRTAAEAFPSPTLVATERGLQNTATGQTAFSGRQAANTEARLNAAQAVVGPDIDAETQAFNQQQGARVAQGQTELPPMSQADATVMSSPAFNEGVTSAQKAADNAGVSHFTDVADTHQANVAQGIDNLAGTPDILDTAMGNRSVQAAQDYSQIKGYVPMTDTDLRDLAARPEFRSAFQEAASRDANRFGKSADAPIMQGQPAAPGQWTPKLVNLKTMQGAKAIMEDAASNARLAGRNNEADGIIKAKNALDSFLKNNSDAYAQANANFAKASAPIDRMQALQSRLVGAVDPTTGEVSPTKLRSAITSILKEQGKPGLRPADRVTGADLNQLATLSQQAKLAPKNMTGLSGQGQEGLRQALEENATKNAGAIKGGDAQQAADAFKQYLATNSPSYRQYFNAASSAGEDLAQRQQLQQAINKLQSTALNVNGVPQLTYTGAKGALKDVADKQGAAGDFARGLLNDLQQSTAKNASLGAAGSQTAANFNLGGGLIGHMLGSHFGEHAAISSIMSGNLLHGGAALLGSKLLKAANIKTEAAAIDLAMNPKRLADALEKFNGQPGARDAFISSLKQKASGAGKAGVRAVQMLNTYQQQQNQ
jgi:hypothetical protein